MASRAAPRRLVTDRDIEVFTALGRCPLTTPQLLKISETFSRPFTSERKVRARLQILCDAGRVRRWLLPIAGRGAPVYYTLSKLGFQLLHGEEAKPPSKRAFDAIPLARQHHTQSLAEFIVHTAVCAKREAFAFTDFYRENTLKLLIGEEALYPDSSFRLIDGVGAGFNYYLEVDCGTERVRSDKEVESWDRKILFYDRYQDSSPRRFRVLIVSTRSTARIEHILERAAKLVRNPERSLFYGISLSEYLAQATVLGAPCFRDHRGRAVALIPERRESARGFLKPGTTLALA